MGVDEKILKCAIFWERLIVEWNGWKLGLAVLGIAYVRYTFHIWFFEFSLGSVGALCTISYVKIFKRLLLSYFFIQFQPTLHKACNQGKYRLLLILVICQILKVYVTLKIHVSSLWQLHCHYPQSYVGFILQRFEQTSRPLGLLFSIWIILPQVFCSFRGWIFIDSLHGPSNTYT